MSHSSVHKKTFVSSVRSGRCICTRCLKIQRNTSRDLQNVVVEFLQQQYCSKLDYLAWLQAMTPPSYMSVCLFTNKTHGIRNKLLQSIGNLDYMQHQLLIPLFEGGWSDRITVLNLRKKKAKAQEHADTHKTSLVALTLSLNFWAM